MKTVLPFSGMSQYDDSVAPELRSSACGPVTAHLLLKHAGLPAYSVDELYQSLRGTRIGLFTFRFVKFLNKLLPSDWRAEKCTLQEALNEIKKGRPVAVKFDKYFSFQFRSETSFSYHWVPMTGFVVNDGELFLLVHDNGGRGRESKLRRIPYGPNHKIVTFVKIAPLQ
ncbi:hypothetical protein AB5N96_08585 [Chryseomicrobium imtechense]